MFMENIINTIVSYIIALWLILAWILKNTIGWLIEKSILFISHHPKITLFWLLFFFYTTISNSTLAQNYLNQIKNANNRIADLEEKIEELEAQIEEVDEYEEKYEEDN